MIKQLEEDIYRIKVNTTAYTIKITQIETVYNDVKYGYSSINKASLYSLWKAMHLICNYDRIANFFAGDQFINAGWRGYLWFKNKKVAKNFLYFIDRKYNPTPQNVTEFIDIELWGNL